MGAKTKAPSLETGVIFVVVETSVRLPGFCCVYHRKSHLQDESKSTNLMKFRKQNSCYHLQRGGESRRSLILDLLQQDELLLQVERSSPLIVPQEKKPLNFRILIGIVGGCVVGFMLLTFCGLAISGGWKDKHNFPPRDLHGDVVSPAASVCSAVSKMSTTTVVFDGHMNPEQLGTCFQTYRPPAGEKPQVST